MTFDRATFLREVGLRIQMLRKARGLTQQDTAALLGVSRATYASLETGRQRLTVDIAWRIAVILGATVNDLLPEPVVTNGTTPSATSTIRFTLPASSESARKRSA